MNVPTILLVALILCVSTLKEAINALVTPVLSVTGRIASKVSVLMRGSAPRMRNASAQLGLNALAKVVLVGIQPETV